MDNYEFTNNWFETSAKAIWSQIFNQTKPKKILEIGSYEGASTCFLIETLSLYHDSFEIYAIDTWDGGVEHKEMKINMKLVEAFFYFKDGTVLKIKSDSGVYNNKTLDMKFDGNVIAKYEGSELFAQKDEYSNSKSFLMISNEVKVKDYRGTMFADKLFFDIKKQTLNIASTKDGKVNANINLK